jgi:RNA polymerase sigma factor (sigma-70 family)
MGWSGQFGRQLRETCVFSLKAGNFCPVETSYKGWDEFVSLEFESLVADYYGSLYKFAYSLTQVEADACDLTQQTFYVWATKGHQLRDVSKVKTWLFTTLHREFLDGRRRRSKFRHYEIGQVDAELPVVSPARVDQLDSPRVLAALAGVDEIYQAPVALFYLKDCSYKEIAEILEVPMGTVKSRIARGIKQLQQLLGSKASSSETERKAS